MSAPQYCARIGLLSSSLSSPTVKDLREANSIMRELRKTAKEDMVFHAFNYGRAVRLKWNELIGLHFGDAGLNNRPCGGSTGGYVTGFADPSILQGVEAKVTILDWRSWRLDRPSKGSNGAEGQAIYDTEDKGWKNRLFWAILNGEKLTRSNSNELASKMESLLIMDSRGCYDAITTSDSVLLGMNNARTGVEMLHVQRGTWCQQVLSNMGARGYESSRQPDKGDLWILQSDGTLSHQEKLGGSFQSRICECS